MTWIFALLATQASAIITVTLIGAAISLSEGRIGAKALGRMLVMDLTVTTTNASLALAGAVIVVYDVRALPLLVVPLVTVFLAYRAYATERQRHESLEFLYETTRTLSRSPEIVVALEGLLARSVEAFRAEIAEIVLFPAEGNAPLRTTLGPGDAREVMQPVDPEIADELRALVDHEEPVRRVTPASGSLRLRRYLEDRGVTHAMLAMLPGETRVVGTMLLANRPGVVRDFSDADLRLFETLATNASVALQYDRLEQTVWQLRELQRQLEHQAYHDLGRGPGNLGDTGHVRREFGQDRQAARGAPGTTRRHMDGSVPKSTPPVTFGQEMFNSSAAIPPAIEPGRHGDELIIVVPGDAHHDRHAERPGRAGDARRMPRCRRCPGRSS